MENITSSLVQFNDRFAVCSVTVQGGDRTITMTGSAFASETIRYADLAQARALDMARQVLEHGLGAISPEDLVQATPPPVSPVALSTPQASLQSFSSPQDTPAPIGPTPVGLPLLPTQPQASFGPPPSFSPNVVQPPTPQVVSQPASYIPAPPISEPEVPFVPPGIQPVYQPTEDISLQENLTPDQNVPDPQLPKEQPTTDQDNLGDLTNVW